MQRDLSSSAAGPATRRSTSCSAPCGAILPSAPLRRGARVLVGVCAVQHERRHTCAAAALLTRPPSSAAAPPPGPAPATCWHRPPAWGRLGGQRTGTNHSTSARRTPRADSGQRIALPAPPRRLPASGSARLPAWPPLVSGDGLVEQASAPVGDLNRCGKMYRAVRWPEEPVGPNRPAACCAPPRAARTERRSGHPPSISSAAARCPAAPN